MGDAETHARAALDMDRMARTPSPVHGLDERAKLLATLGVLLGVALVPREESWRLGLLAALVLLGARLGRVPLAFLATRAATLLPFALVFAASAPLAPGPLLPSLERSALTIARAAVSLLAVTLLAATTPWHHVLRALTSLGAPRALVLVLQFLHRYLFVLVEEAQTLRRARALRMASGGSLSLTLSSGAGVIGALFLRTLERAERIEAAMAARGFTGEIRVLAGRAFGVRDGIALTLVFLLTGLAVMGGAP